MPSRADLQWSQLKVGIVVAVAAAILIVVIFAMTGETGLFTRKLHLVTYVNNAAGLLTGASVNLEGVAIGNVTGVQLAQNPPNPATPVRIDMSVTSGHERWLRTDSVVVLGTAGPLGQTLVNINAGSLSAPPARDGTVLKSQEATGINELLVSTHTVVQNANLLVQRIGQILDQIQNGQGSIGKLLYSEQLYDRLNAIALNVQKLTDTMSQGKGTIGKLAYSDELYNKLNTTLDSLNSTLNQLQHGKGTMARLLNDPSLYDHSDQLINNLRATTANLNAGKGAIGALMTDSQTSQKLEDTIRRLDQVLADLQAGKGTAGKLLTDESMYNNVNHLMTTTQGLIQAIRVDPKKYLTIHLKIF